MFGQVNELFDTMFMIDAFADGVAFVALDSVGTPNQIVSAIGDTLGLAFAGHADPTAHLLGYLRDGETAACLSGGAAGADARAQGAAPGGRGRRV